MLDFTTIFICEYQLNQDIMLWDPPMFLSIYVAGVKYTWSQPQLYSIKLSYMLCVSSKELTYVKESLQSVAWWTIFYFRP
jgi:hypothetical protein